MTMSQIKLQNHPDSDEQPEDERNYELPPLVILTEQRYIVIHDVSYVNNCF